MGASIMEAITVAAGLSLLAVFGGACLYILLKGKSHGYEIKDETRQTLDHYEAQDGPAAGGYR
ncbi:MAG: hypothetical protein GY906_22785 [bacterium]|nr:hypothetical protein [bacterium]